MNKIQIDMFEVQLGAALLLQFRDSSGTAVVILADAGVHAGGYPIHHIRDKLPIALDAFEQGNRRIDLIVGTHYDADHLRGLAPIIDDPQFDIGEAWLPPVADDVSPNAIDSRLSNDQFLAMKWGQEDGPKYMGEYLKFKLDQCSKLKELENKATEFPSFSEKAFHRQFRHPTISPAPNNEGILAWRDVFQLHVEDTSELPGESHKTCHADEIYSEAYPSESQRVENLMSRGASPVDLPMVYFGHRLVPPLEISTLSQMWEVRPDLAHPQSLSLAAMRLSIANDAITGTHLGEVVQALHRREVPIRCHVIPDGIPQRFIWDNGRRKFVRSTHMESDGPELKLLGPSVSLVEKHRDRLPFETYILALARTAIPIRGITPSNQLSSIFRIESEGQGILVTGDAGCVDFKPTPRGAYYPEIIGALLPLHVIQVAHHAGLNSHFYRVLLEANYSHQSGRSFLLLSHATKDKHRPSPEFSQFIDEAQSSVNDLSLLFTSEPDETKVQEFKNLIHPLEGARASVGDVQLVYDSTAWLVTRHSVAI